MLSGGWLREVEKRIDQLTVQVAAVWLTAMLATLALVIGSKY